MGTTHAARRMLVWLFAGVAVTFFCLAAAAPNAFAYFASRIYNAGSGTCMSSGGTHTGGADARLYTCNGSANQTWVNAVRNSGGSLFKNLGDGWCLNNYRGRAANYNPQTLWPCDASSWMQAYYVYSSRVAPGYYNIETVNASGNITGYCLSSLGNRNNGAIVEEFACNNTYPNQAWEGGTLTPP